MFGIARVPRFLCCEPWSHSTAEKKQRTGLAQVFVFLVFTLGLASCEISDSGGSDADDISGTTSSAPPTVTPPANITVAATDANGTASTDPAVTGFLAAANAFDTEDGAITTISNDAPALLPLGINTVMFSATDSDGNTGTAQATVTVSDQTAPIVTLLGLSSITLNVGDPYFDAGATANDNVDGDLTTAIVSGGSVNVNVIGLYTLTYDVSDAAGNAAIQVTRNVSVQDSGAPVVTPPGSITVAATDASGTAASDPAIVTFLAGATALDAVDGPIATITNDAPAQFVLGVNTITFSSTDSSSNTGQAQATVTVADQAAPVVTAPADIIVTATSPGGIPVTDPAIVAFLAGASAVDNVDGPIGAIGNDAPALLPVGATSVTFSATDGAVNTGTAQASVTVTTFVAVSELIDPTPGAGDRFGQTVRILANGNIVVSDVFDSSVVAGNGAVHLYDPATQALIGSVYGEETNDNLGSGGIVPLPNGNFVVVSPRDDNGASVDVSSVRLINGITGVQIGLPLYGNNAGDNLGFEGFTASTLVTPLGNNNFVIASPGYTVGANASAGSVQLVSGVDRTLIATLTGAAFFDSFGLGGAVALANDNFVIVSPAFSLGFVTQEGSVTYVDGVSGAVIATFTGDNPADQLGVGGVIPLANGNFVISSPMDDEGGTDTGSIMLIDGATGTQIGATLIGDTARDRLGFSVIGGVKALANSNFVVSSSLDDETFIDGGSVRLISGTTGLQIGQTIEGAAAGEQLELVTVHANNTFMVASPLFDDGATADVGSLSLYSGLNATQIGTTFIGDIADDQLGLGSVIQLVNDNYAIASINDDEGGVVNAGSIMVWDGILGSQVGATIAGDVMTDQLGFGSIIALSNNNFVVGSTFDDEGAVVDAGSVRLVDGATGIEVATIVGDVANDMLGSGGLFALANGNFVIVSDFDDEGGNADVGSVRLIDGTTGAAIGSPLLGTAANDFSEAVVTSATTGGDHVLGLSRSDKGGLVDSGQAFLIEN